MAGRFRRPCRLRRAVRDRHDQQFGREGAPRGRGREKGGIGEARGQAIGRSRGGRTTKIHALCDQTGRPHAILLTGGNVADIAAAAPLVAAIAPSANLIADKGYDANHLRRRLDRRGTAAVIPSTRSRKRPIPHDTDRYKLRNVIERSFCRIKDFRGIATRYDKTARNFLAAVCLVAAILWWT